MSRDQRDATHLPSVVSIGFFDGVHLGHRRLIARTRELAQQQGLVSAIVTFDRHPATVIRPEFAPKLLTSFDEKLELLESSGVDEVVVIHFDQARARQSAEDFVEEVLIRELSARAVVVGTSFRFGFERRGDTQMLVALGKTMGFAAYGFDLVTDDDQHGVVSSSRIRALIGTGELAEAARLLGRHHEVRGFITTLSSPAPYKLGLAVDSDLVLPPPGRYVAQFRTINGVPNEAVADVVGDMVQIELIDHVPNANVEVHAGSRAACAFVASALSREDDAGL